MIETGATAEITAVVGDADTALALGSGDVAVLGTPRVVAWVEAAAVAALNGTLEPGVTSVGTRIDLEHLAPSPVGATVTAEATVTEVSGRRIEFRVGASMNGNPVARGVHTRVTVRRDGFGQ